MVKLSFYTLLLLTTVFMIFLARAYMLDNTHGGEACTACEYTPQTPAEFHVAVRDTIKWETQHGSLSHNRVKKLLAASRDQVVRGLIVGAIEGSVGAAMHGAVMWSLVGGIVSGISDVYQWRNAF